MEALRRQRAEESTPQTSCSELLLRLRVFAEEPHPLGARKLQGSEHTYRIREGAYRVIYEVDAKAVTITIVTVAHRREAYRR